ncbi:hypothetical protein PG997_005700 [Apiospora hydei]|uniref:Uncharacterized protein n=1 Tax=Apiospora hydei TaxID=1337664 RepID=A0ABR1WLL9_9PEZI
MTRPRSRQASQPTATIGDLGCKPHVSNERELLCTVGGTQKPLAPSRGGRQPPCCGKRTKIQDSRFLRLAQQHNPAGLRPGQQCSASPEKREDLDEADWRKEKAKGYGIAFSGLARLAVLIGPLSGLADAEHKTQDPPCLLPPGDACFGGYMQQQAAVARSRTCPRLSSNTSKDGGHQAAEADAGGLTAEATPQHAAQEATASFDAQLSLRGQAAAAAAAAETNPGLL